jgi:hypothetical protein
MEAHTVAIDKAQRTDVSIFIIRLLKKQVQIHCGFTASPAMVSGFKCAAEVPAARGEEQTDAFWRRNR